MSTAFLVTMAGLTLFLVGVAVSGVYFRKQWHKDQHPRPS